MDSNYSLVPVEHDPFDDNYSVVPIDHDPFATPKPGQVVPPPNVLGNINAATAAAGRLIGPNLAAYVNAPPLSAAIQPTGNNGKIRPEERSWTDAIPAPGDIAGLAMMGVDAPEMLAGRALLEAEPAATALASRSARLYNPVAKAERQFSADYPTGAITDAQGNLTADIEGRPLTAQYVAGRRVAGAIDESLSGPQIFDAATQVTGQSPAAVANRAIGGDAGRYYRELDRRSGRVLSRNIVYDLSLSQPQADSVVAHEFGHVIDEIAAQIPQDSPKTELKQLYNTLNTGQERLRNLTGPKNLGYSDADVPKEFMAEAIRGYMTNPNTIKTVAPKTAAAIRDAVNNNPQLSKIIQFNAIPAIADGGAGYHLVPVDHDPFAQGDGNAQANH
jgi:hypothetical protein